jgi:hypothetical protein
VTIPIVKFVITKVENMNQSDKERNQKVLDSFVSYCKRHPELRFWQALASWSDASLIYVKYFEEEFLRDTYNWEGRYGN